MVIPTPSMAAWRLCPDVTRIPIRTQVRSAVERAWARAISDGALPALPEDAARPTVEVERPADASYGDFATKDSSTCA